MRVAISGASGLIGGALARALREREDDPVALVRRPARAGEIQWDPTQPLDPAKLAGCDAVVHLAGKNVAGRWTESFKQELLQSRVQGTRTLATAAAESFCQSGMPRVFVSASGANYYGNRGDELLTEDSSAGAGFLAEITKQWEAATAPANKAGLRVVNLRIGMVLASDGGALKKLLLPFRLGLGGRIGSGKQYLPWIALDDMVGAILFCVANEGLRGPVNIVGPAPARNEELVRALGEALHRPTIFPLPEWVIRNVFGEMGEELLLISSRVLPAKLTAAGYRFLYPGLQGAMNAVVRGK